MNVKGANHRYRELEDQIQREFDSTQWQSIPNEDYYRLEVLHLQSIMERIAQIGYIQGVTAEKFPDFSIIDMESELTLQDIENLLRLIKTYG